MEIGLSTATFFGRETTEDSFEVIRELGVDVCEVFLTTFSEFERDYVDALVERRNGVRVYSVHSLNTCYEPELYNRVLRTRNDSYKIYHQLCYAAKVLGAGSYTFHGPARLKRTPYVLDYDYLGERTRELCDTIKEYGAELAYENVHWAFFNEPPFFIELSKRVPELRACLDIKQAMQAKVDYIEYIKCMGDRLVNVHVCDYDADGALKAPGKGTFDFVTFFKILRDYGYDGPIMTELYGSNYKDYKDLGDSLEYLRNCLEKAVI